MLTGLSIKNYALIDQLQVNFNDGFTIITGETGAGKSILLVRTSITEIPNSSVKLDVVEVTTFRICVRSNEPFKKWDQASAHRF